MISRRVVLALGCSQLICWGTSYYAIGALAASVGADLGWARTGVFSGPALAWLVMGAAAPIVGTLIDRYGGRRVMTAGSCLASLGCLVLLRAHGVGTYLAAWICLGLAMRATLYDAAFATLARLSGAGSRRAMSQITLLGGLASTVFWPISRTLSTWFTWRGALAAYAGLAALTIPLHLMIPDHPHPSSRTGRTIVSRLPGGALQAPDERRAACLYSAIVALATTISVGMSAHMIGILQGMGVRGATIVAALLGVGQSCARLADVALGGTIEPLMVNVIAPAVMLGAFVIGAGGGGWVVAAAAFTFLYGVANGLLTITRGTVPLVLFERSTYGRLVGILQVPASLVGALSPVAYAAALDHAGSFAVLVFSAVLSSFMLASAGALAVRYGQPGS